MSHKHMMVRAAWGELLSDAEKRGVKVRPNARTHYFVPAVDQDIVDWPYEIYEIHHTFYGMWELTKRGYLHSVHMEPLGCWRDMLEDIERCKEER